MKSKLLSILLLFSSLAFAQTVHFPGKETNNTFTGTNQFTAGAQFGPVFFANLPASPDGTILYCSDCQATSPALGSGTGAFVQRVNGQWLGAAGGGGGGGSLPGGVNTNIQFNDNGVLGGNTSLLFNKTTSTFTLPDGSTWSPSGIFPPTPTTNTVIHFDSSTAQNHAVVLKSPTNGELCLQGGGVGFNFACITGDTYLSTPSAIIQTGDASSHFVSMLLVPFGQSTTDQLGYTFANGGVHFTSDLTSLPNCLFCIDRTNKSVHVYGGLVLPNGAGTGNSYGAAGAALVSQGSGLAPIWSSDLTGVFAQVGTFGSCAGVTVSASQSAYCFGPSGHIQASWAGDSFQDLVRANSIPASGITGLVEPNQIDETNPGGLGGLYQGLNAITQYVIPEGGGANAGLQNGPFTDAADNIVTATKPLDLGSQTLAIDVANCSSTGTTANKLVKFSSSAGATCAVIASVADTQGEMGVCVARCGTTGTAVIAIRGKASLIMDGGTTVNDWVINSPSAAGNGRDTGSTTAPTSGAQVIGRVLSTNGATGTYTVWLGGADTSGGAGGGGGSPGGSSGQIEWNNAGSFAGFTASGDFTLVPSTGIGTVTGLNGTSLAGLATGLLQNTTGTGVPVVVTAIPNGDTATTQAANSNDTKIATDAYVDRVIANPLFTGNTSFNILRNTADTTMTSTTAAAISNVTWWTLPANLAATYDLDCNIAANQNSAATALTWSINDVTVAPTAGAVRASYQAGSTGGSGTGVTWTTSGSKTIITFTPPSTGAFVLSIHATWEQPSNASTSVLQLELAVTSGGTDTVTIKRDGLACRLGVTAN